MERGEYQGARLILVLIGDFRLIAQRLRQDNPGANIRNAEVFTARAKEFSERGWIVRVNNERDLPDWINDYGRGRLRRLGFPMWMPHRGHAFEPFGFLKEMPAIKNGPRRRSGPQAPL